MTSIPTVIVGLVPLVLRETAALVSVAVCASSFVVLVIVLVACVVVGVCVVVFLVEVVARGVT